MEVWIFFGMIIAGVVAYSIITDKVNYEKRAIADAATAKKVKQAVTGNGNADKTQLQYMIKQIFKLKQLPAPLDASDAIGIALRLIRYGDADIMLTGGTEASITPLTISGFANMKALSQNYYL